MKRNKVIAMLLGMGLMAGILAVPVTIPKTTVYAAASTQQVIGHGEWKQENGKWYYYQDGNMLKNCWVKDGIDWYMLNEDGTMKSDEFIKIDNDLYYFRGWGGMLYNSWYTDAEGNRYYFRDWGGALNTGWKQIGNDWYYFDKENCKAHANTFEKIDKDLYAFDENGKMLHDTWYTKDGNRYYLRDWGGALNTGWKQIGNDWYYFDKENCKAHANTFEKIDKDLYAFDADGRMLHDTWYTKDGNRYYLRGWGGALNTGWVQMDGNWYYFDQGTCVAYADTIRKIDNDVYGFDADGKMLHDCWVEADGIHYYFRGWGGAFHDQTVTIDGKEYVFDSSCNGTLKNTAVPTPQPTETPDPIPTETPNLTPTETPEEIKVRKIIVSGNQEMTAGATQKLTAAVTPDNAANKAVSWSSSNPDAASVSSDGTVTAHQAGTVTITATAADGSGVSGSIQITVKAQNVEVSELYVLDANGVDQGTTLTVIGETSQLTLDIRPANATDKTVTWWSEHPEIATVDQNGKVTAVSEGWTYIYAQTANGCIDNTTVSVSLPKTDEDYLDEIVYDEEMSRQVFDLVNQQRVLEGHLEMEWSDGFEKDQAIAVAGNNLLRLMKGEDDFDSLSDHNGSQNGLGGQKKNLTANDIFSQWMSSPAHKANQMDDFITASSYVVMYKEADDGSKIYSAIASLAPFKAENAGWEDGDSYMKTVMTEDTYNMLLAHFKK